ncbi:MAG: hypothetical protein ACXAEI_20520 [Candidatus Hodarchaeales archaeon]
MPLKTSDIDRPQKSSHLDDYAQNINRILQMHDSVEVIRSDGTVVRLK